MLPFRSDHEFPQESGRIGVDGYCDQTSDALRRLQDENNVRFGPVDEHGRVDGYCLYSKSAFVISLTRKRTQPSECVSERASMAASSDEACRIVGDDMAVRDEKVHSHKL